MSTDELPRPGDLYTRAVREGRVDVIFITAVGGEGGGIRCISYIDGVMYHRHWTWESGTVVKKLRTYYELTRSAGM